MSTEPLEEPSEEPSELLTLKSSPAGFDYFWTVYPRRVGRLKAEAAFAAALKRGVDPSHIVAGASRYAVDPNRVDEFTAHPTTWLNRGGWEDDPLPARGGRDRQGDILAAELVAARANDERRAAVAGALEAFPAPAGGRDA